MLEFGLLIEGATFSIERRPLCGSPLVWLSDDESFVGSVILGEAYFVSSIILGVLDIFHI